MEKINGISFEDWAASCGQLTQGMSEDEVCKTLGIEAPVWQETLQKWTDRLGDMMAEDINVSVRYGEIFANPNIGPYADKGIGNSEEQWRAIVPDYQTYLKIQREMTKDSDAGGDAQTFLESNYGLNVGQWSQIAMNMLQQQNNMSHEELHKEMREGMINPEYAEQMEKICPTYQQFLALEAAVDEISEKEEDKKAQDEHYVSFFPEREYLSTRGIDMDLYNFMENHYEKFAEEKEDEMGQDEFLAWQDDIYTQIEDGKIAIPLAKADEDDLAGDIDF